MIVISGPEFDFNRGVVLLEQSAVLHTPSVAARAREPAPAGSCPEDRPQRANTRRKGVTIVLDDLAKLLG